MSNANQLADQVIANMSEEMKKCFIGSSSEDQIELATQMAIDSIRKNERFAILFRTSPAFRTLVESGILTALTD